MTEATVTVTVAGEKFEPAHTTGVGAHIGVRVDEERARWGSVVESMRTHHRATPWSQQCVPARGRAE
ncbi:hypothetical protein P3H15_48330 [Rhodococcus sp. T2V]|uniref:hypothetical protein n=1 Tax=Rhodococcus sp. T2V TaxID=3034164 RepID=UPI0023E16659|nr:hypothetical protein [Rhodococcus sp. T2V]MDF3312752.1 hypothetical protein [Rhodococcus sp. T2V]